MSMEIQFPHIYSLSRLRFYKESKEEKFKDKFLHWAETDVLCLDRTAAKTRHDPVLSRITNSRIGIKTNGEIVPEWKDPAKK